MAHFLIFSSAADGNHLAKILQRNGVEVCISTDSGVDFTTPTGLHVFKEPEDVEDLATLLQSLRFDCVIDASHSGISGQCEKRKAACAYSDIRYLRLVRTPCTGEECMYVDSGEKAAGILSATTGKALLTIGMRDLENFTGVPDFCERIYLRIRPSASIIEQCLSMGFRRENLIAMEGPFSRELNGAMLRQIGASLLVTRMTDSNDIVDKLLAAQDAGATAVVIGKAREDRGLTYSELLEVLERDYGICDGPKSEPWPLFPVFVNLRDCKIVVFGGNASAARRTELLLGFGRRIAVIAPQFDSLFDRLEAVRIERPYLRGDCEGYQYVFALTGNRELNRIIAEEAQAQSIPIFLEDAPEESDFSFPEIIQREQSVVGACFYAQERKLVQGVMLSIGERIDSALARRKEAEPKGTF